MTLQSGSFTVTELEWLKIQLRIVALEHSGPKLSYRFDFPTAGDDLTCDIYYVDSDQNPMNGLSQGERLEIYEGRIELGMDVIRSGFRRAQLPVDFVWKPTINFVLYEDCGMGGSVVHKDRKMLSWPEL